MIFLGRNTQLKYYPTCDMVSIQYKFIQYTQTANSVQIYIFNCTCTLHNTCMSKLCNLNKLKQQNTCNLSYSLYQESAWHACMHACGRGHTPLQTWDSFGWPILNVAFNMVWGVLHGKYFHNFIPKNVLPNIGIYRASWKYELFIIKPDLTNPLLWHLCQSKKNLIWHSEVELDIHAYCYHDNCFELQRNRVVMVIEYITHALHSRL